MECAEKPGVGVGPRLQEESPAGGNFSSSETHSNLKMGRGTGLENLMVLRNVQEKL